MGWGGSACSLAAEGGAHALNGLGHIPRDERRRQPQHAPLAALELAIPPRIRHAPSNVVRTIDFDHEPRPGHGEPDRGAGRSP